MRLFYFAAALTCLQTAPALAQWDSAAAMAEARHQTIAAEANGKIYVITGSAPGEQASGLNQEYDPATRTWRDLSPMPGIASHAGGAATGGKVYVVGGFTANPHAGAMDSVWEYDPATDTWREATKLSSARGSANAVALNGRLHVIGGRGPDGVTMTNHEVYDPATETWTSAAPLPIARDHMGAIVAEGRIHVVGGRTDGIDTNGAWHHVYDPASGTWTEAAPLPTARSGGAIFEGPGFIGYYGGECRRDPNRTFDEVEIYDLGSGTWESAPSPGHGIHGAPSVTVDGVPLIFGGSIACGGGDERSMNVYRFTR